PRRPPSPPRFPYTTLFRSPRRPPGDGGLGLLRLLRLRRCADGGRAAVVREPLPAAAADGVLRPALLLPALRGPHRRGGPRSAGRDRKSTRLNSSHVSISYA